MFVDGLEEVIDNFSLLAGLLHATSVDALRYLVIAYRILHF